MSLACREEIGLVGRVGQGCYDETAPVEFQLIAVQPVLLPARIAYTAASGEEFLPSS